MIAFPAEWPKPERRCECAWEYRISRREHVEVMPDLSRMSRHDRRTMEAIARKYGIELRKAS